MAKQRLRAVTEAWRRRVERRIDWNALALLGEARAAESTAVCEQRSSSRSRASNWSISRGKRVLDCVLASVVLTCALVPMLLIALLVKLSSPGPVIYRQLRVGRLGQLFTIYKFRTMRQRKQEQANAPILNTPTLMDGAHRVTGIGRWLRQSKLDELPQLWNILKGEMSFVGPRPKLAHLEAIVQMPYRPGITGAASLIFRNEETMLQPVPLVHLDHFYDRRVKPLKARIDMRYMRQATLRSDLEMMLLTVVSWILPARRPASFRFADQRLHRPADRPADHFADRFADHSADRGQSAAQPTMTPEPISIAPMQAATRIPAISTDPSLMA